MAVTSETANYNYCTIDEELKSPHFLSDRMKNKILHSNPEQRNGSLKIMIVEKFPRRLSVFI